MKTAPQHRKKTCEVFVYSFYLYAQKKLINMVTIKKKKVNRLDVILKAIRGLLNELIF